MSSKKCPACHRPLKRVSTAAGFVYACENCRGRVLNVMVLRKAEAGKKLLATVVGGEHEEPDAGPGPCPHCGADMSKTVVNRGGRPVELGVCRTCQTVWMDGAAYEEVVEQDQASTGGDAGKTEAPDQNWKELARRRLGQLQEQEKQKSGPSTRSPWKIGLSFLLVPSEQDAPASCDRPWATWSLLAACTVFTILWLSSFTILRGSPGQSLLIPSNGYLKWGFAPARWSQWGGLTILSSFFLHAGAAHLVLNGYFLYLFGDSVEALLGRARFLGLVFVSHGAGLLLHSLFCADPTVPTVGASGGIYGVLAFYAVNFPRARLGFIFPSFSKGLKRFRVPAVALFLVYGALQLIGLFFAGTEGGGVNYLGHLGGLGLGLTAAVLYRIVHAGAPGARTSPTD